MATMNIRAITMKGQYLSTSFMKVTRSLAAVYRDPRATVA